MKIEHIAIWVQNLEVMRRFYTHYFNLQSNELYHNPKRNFSSYFLSFQNGARIELMHQPGITGELANSEMIYGYAHIAISLGSKAEVDRLTNQISNDGYELIGKPRITGDGYYESVIQDPEGNIIELTL